EMQPAPAGGRAGRRGLHLLPVDLAHGPVDGELEAEDERFRVRLGMVVPLNRVDGHEVTVWIALPSRPALLLCKARALPAARPLADLPRRLSNTPMTDEGNSGPVRLPIRLDVELVRRGLAASRTQARAASEAGGVKVNGAAATKPGQLVAEDATIDWTPAHPWVSRGGLKLAHALEVFGVDPAGRACLDVGASTGGFTEV